MVLYFAFGSNMLASRLTQRCPSSKFVGTAALAGYGFRFNKLSSAPPPDRGSGKANVQSDALASVNGVLYEMTDKDFETLKGMEKGYNHVQIDVTVKGKVRPVWTFVAQPGKVKAGLRPTQEYLAMIVRGARNHKLGEDYIGEIERAARG